MEGTPQGCRDPCVGDSRRDAVEGTPFRGAGILAWAIRGATPWRAPLLGVPGSLCRCLRCTLVRVQVEDLPLRYRLLLRTYAWRAVRPVPCATLEKPLSQARIALVTTAGLMGVEHVPFDLFARGGDVTFRVIAGDVDPQTLQIQHRSKAFDRSAVSRDRNVAFPLDRLRELVADGTIGDVAPRHLSFMGSITAPGRLRAETAPQAAALLVQDQVDVALLVPV